MKLISTYWRESDNATAQVFGNEEDGYAIQYYDSSGMLIDKESYPGKSVRFHEDAAENWALGIKSLPL